MRVPTRAHCLTATGEPPLDFGFGFQQAAATVGFSNPERRITMLASPSARAAAVLASLALSSAPALAQGTAEERSACMGDAFRFCASDIPDVPAIESCLIKNMSKLSKDCQEEFHKAPEGKTRMKPEHFK